MALLAIPAFIASVASTLSLQVDLLSDCGKNGQRISPDLSVGLVSKIR